MKRLAVFLILCALGTALGGCSWMGRTAGKTQAKIERKAQEVEQGYHQGYKKEKDGAHKDGEQAGQTQAEEKPEE